jgi:pimeloyl-ACP methyl ester carboxylesterase
MKHLDTVPIGSARLAVRRIPAEHPDAPVIVFLHEALGSIGQWKSFPAELCAVTECRGLVYDRVGHGHSSAMPRPRSVTFYRDEADALLALCEAEGIARPLLFGHSDGATIALSFGGRHPLAPLGIISEAAHVLAEPVMRPAFGAAMEAWLHADLRKKLHRYHGENTDDVFHAWNEMWHEADAADWEMFGDLRAIRCPVLALQGSNDAFGSDAQLQAIKRECGGPTELLLIPRCGHVPHLEARKILLEKCASFIRSLA